MTTQEIIDYYADLLILQYVGKPKAYAHVQALVRMVVMDQLPVAVQDAFGIDDAVGDQLDVLGQYAGVERSGRLLDGSLITLDDSDFRSLIKMAIIRNVSGSSLYDIQNLLYTFFPGEIYAFDSANMQMSFFMMDSAGSQELAQMFLVQNLFPKPMGVELSALVYLPVGTDLFGMRDYEAPAPDTVSPFNSYDDYREDRPWLTYSDVITI